MSDFEHPDDELVSADLDGEATAEESARVARDPALVARRAEFEAVASRVGDVPGPPAALREEHLRVALAAATDESPDDAVGEDAPPPPPPTSLADRRRRRQVALLSAAAVVLVAFLGVAVYRATGGSDDGETNLAATEPDTEVRALDSAPGGSDFEATDEGDAAAAPLDAEDLAGIEPGLSDRGEATVVELGGFASSEELTSAVTAAIDEYLLDESGYFEQGRRPPFTPSATAQLDPSSPTAACAAGLAAADAEVGALLWVGNAGLSGEPVTILLFEVRPEAGANGLLRLYTVDAACQPLPGGVQTFTP